MEDPAITSLTSSTYIIVKKKKKSLLSGTYTTQYTLFCVQAPKDLRQSGYPTLSYEEFVKISVVSFLRVFMTDLFISVFSKR